MPRNALVRHVACALVAAAAHAQNCPSQGLTLSAEGGRLGDAWSVAVFGLPFAPGVLAFDAASGPTSTPIGTVCLGMTPALQLFPMTLDGSGAFFAGGFAPANATLAGATLHVQAVAADASYPSGFAISGAASATLRSPKMFFVAPGVVSPFGTTPGAFAAVNVLTETTPYNVPLVTSVIDVAHAPKRRMLALLRADGVASVYFEDSAALAFDTAPLNSPPNPTKIAATPNGEKLLVLSSGFTPSPFGGGSPGGLHVFSLPSGAPWSTTTFGAGNPNAVIVESSSGLAYVRFSNQVVPIDPASGAVFPTIPLSTAYGPIVDWTIANGFLYCLHGGLSPSIFGGGGTPGAITMIDPFAFTVVLTTPIVGVAPYQLLRAGPGTTGPSLYVFGASGGFLYEFAQFTVTPTGSIGGLSAVTAIALSTLETEWLLLCGGGTCSGPALLSMAAGTLTPVVAAPLIPGFQSIVGVSGSDTFGKAYLVSGSGTAVPVFTDPVVPPFATISLPVSSNSFRLLSDKP